MPSRLIIGPDGGVTKETYSSQRVDFDLAEHFRKLARAGLMFVTPSFGPMGPENAIRDLRFVIHNSETSTALVRLDRLNFHTVWETCDGFLRPTFEKIGVKIDPEAAKTLLCPVPDFLEIWWALSYRAGFSLANGLSDTSMFGIITTPSSALTLNPELPRRRAVVIPLPNTYSNGCICTGRLPTGSTTNNLVQDVVQVYMSWFQAPWNIDLFDGFRQQFCNLFRWTPEGQFDPADHTAWFENCRAVDFDEDRKNLSLFVEHRMKELE